MREKLWIFIAKFVAVSLILFTFWYWKGQSYYIKILDTTLTSVLITLLGFNIEYFSYPADIFNNLIPFVSLMIITRHIKFKKRMSQLGWGLLILILWHIILSQAIYFLHDQYQRESPLYEKLSVPLYLFSETLPFLLWILFARKQVVDLFMPRKTEAK
jgi:amino acid transporter